MIAPTSRTTKAAGIASSRVTELPPDKCARFLRRAHHDGKPRVTPAGARERQRARDAAAARYFFAGAGALGAGAGALGVDAGCGAGAGCGVGAAFGVVAAGGVDFPVAGVSPSSDPPFDGLVVLPSPPLFTRSSPVVSGISGSDGAAVASGLICGYGLTSENFA